MTIRNWGVASVAVWTVLAATVNAARFVTLAAEGPEFAVPEQAGTWIGSHLKPGDSVWVVSAQVFPAYALAAYSGLTYDSILDARVDAVSLKAHVAQSTEVYVVDMQGSQTSLPATDAALVLALDERQLPAERCPVNAAAVWKVPSGSLIQWLASR